MDFLRAYLRSHSHLFLVTALSCAFFFLSFALYDLPLAAVLYPTFVCAVFWALAAALDFWRAWRRHRLLRELSLQPDALLEAPLPPSRTPEETDYQALLALLRQQQRDLRTRMELRYADLSENYTIWTHQIKTPIASMRLTLQNEDSPLSRTLTAELLRVEQYVEMALLFLRLDAHASDYVIEPCNLDAIVRHALKRFAGEFIRRKLRLRYTSLPETVLTDSKWLTFVVEQLLSNALKYTPSGEISIFLEPEQTLCIRDTGIGIAPEDLPRIFEKGYTGYNGRLNQRASGIGLYLCKRVCDALNTPIWVESVPDEGTCVRLRLARQQLELE